MTKPWLRSRRATSKIACVVGIIVCSAAAAAASEAQNVADCVAFEQDAVDNGVLYRLVNQCERRVTCSVRWTLYCGDKPPLRQVKNSSTASIAPATERSITASTTACALEGWEIANVSWVCSP